MPEEIKETIKKDRFTIKNLSQISLWIALVMLLLMSLVLIVYQNSIKKQGRGSSQSLAQKSGQTVAGISSLSQKAFGSLSMMNNAIGQRSEITRPSALISGGLNQAKSQAVAAYGTSADSKISMPYNPEAVVFNYIYEGEALVLKNDLLSVYRRAKGGNNILSLNAITSQFEDSLIDWAKFQNAKVNNLSLSEDKDFGYNLDVNFAESTLSISQNWLKWPHPEQNCTEEKCFQENRLKIEQILSDEEAKAIANSFIAEKGIDLSSYGEPELQNEWREDYALAKDKENYYIPEELGVVYPLMVQGQVVYEMYGGKSGLMVSVNMKNKKVSSVYNLASQNYEESKYEAVTDSEKVLAIVKKGGLQNYGPYGGSPEKEAKMIDVKLGAGTVALIKYFNYNEKSFVSEEMLIPALVFPVVNFDEVKNNFYQKSIVIPLVKEIFDKEVENLTNRPDPILYKTPISNGDVGGVVGSPVEGGERPAVVPFDLKKGMEPAVRDESKSNVDQDESEPSPM